METYPSIEGRHVGAVGPNVGAAGVLVEVAQLPETAARRSHAFAKKRPKT